MSTPLHSNHDVGETAAVWLARHDRGLTPAESLEFAAWREGDWRHAEEFGRLQQEWSSFGMARGDARLAREAELLDRATASLKRSAPAIAHRWRPFVHGLAAAAAIAIAAFVGLRDGGLTTARPANYEVVPSAARELKLEDGSVVELRGESQVQVSFTARERAVDLVRGEAHFTVAKNPARPFVVRAGNVAVRAVGTAFNVRRDTAAVEVLVTEGRVQVDDTHGQGLIAAPATDDFPLLHAGQRLRVNVSNPGNSEPSAATPAEAVTVFPTEIEQILSWQKTRLIFHRTSLEDAVSAFNEHGRCRIAIGDDGLRSQLLGGTFRADNVEAFIRLLEQGAEVRAERRSDGSTVLRSAK